MPGYNLRMFYRALGQILLVQVLLGDPVTMAVEPDRWQFRDDRLDNGLRVITLEDDRSPIVGVQAWYHVGSKDEDPERQGFAHMFEHMMFRGTDRIGPQDHFKYLSRYGAQVNGYTSFDQTVYWETLPASQLDLALWLEAERMANLKINEDYFAAEREVVKEERRMRCLNRPYGKLYETLFGSAYQVHPYRWTPIGNMPHLNAATVDELRAFFKKFYVPNNATLVVVGEVRHEEVAAKARQYFGAIPRQPEPPRVAITEPPMTGPRRVEITDRAPSPRVVFAYHAPSAPDPDAIPLSILRRIMSTGQSSRLYRHLVQSKELAVDVYAHDYALEQGGLFTLSATLKPEVTVEVAEQAMLDEIRLILAEGIEPAELDKAKNQAVAEYVRQGETVGGRASLLGYATVVLGDPERVNTDLDHIRAVTANEVLAVARRVLTPDNRTTVVIRPDENPSPPPEVQDTSEGAGEDIPDLPPPAEMPTGEPPRPVNLPFPALRKLASGLQVVVFTDHSVPAVTVSFNSLIGGRNDRPDRPGLGFVTAATLRRGTKKHTGDELAERIDSHAMSLSESVQHESTAITLWTLAEHLDLAVETLAEVVREPTFPEEEVIGFSSRAAAREAINEENPSITASRALARTLFGENYLAQPATGTSASLKNITREAVVQFHQRFFAPRGASLIFAGDVTAEQAVALAERWFGDWQGQVEAEEYPPPPEPASRRILLVDQPGAVQSEIRIGQVVPLSRRDRDYAAARLLAHIFGGSFDSRLNRSLRIEKGLTYGAQGYFDVEADAAAFEIRTFTRTDKTAEAIQVILAEIDRLGDGEITGNELENARDTLIGGFQMALQTPAQVARRWWDLVTWNLPERWYSNYLRHVARTADQAELNRVAIRLLDPRRLTIVVAGNASEIQAELSRIAPVETDPGTKATQMP